MTTRAPSHRIRVLVVEDHVVWAVGITSLLASDPRVDCVGFARTVEEGNAMVQEHEPDVILLDLKLDADWGIRLARLLHFKGNKARIAIITDEPTRAARKAAAECGVVGFVDKSTLYDGDMAGLVCAIATRRAPIDADSGGIESPLTDRETEYLICLRDELETEDMMRRFSVSEQTVRNTVSGIRRKMGFEHGVGDYRKTKARQAIVKEAIRLGFIKPRVEE